MASNQNSSSCNNIGTSEANGGGSISTLADFFKNLPNVKNWGWIHYATIAGGIIIAAVVFLGNFFTAIDALTRLFTETLPNATKWLGTLDGWIRAGIIALLLVTLAIFVAFAIKATNDKRKIGFGAATIFPSIIIVVMAAQNPGQAEVVTRNIGLVYNSDRSLPNQQSLESTASTAVIELQRYSNLASKISVKGFDLSTRPFDHSKFRTFVKESSIRYLIITEQLDAEDLNFILDQTRGLSLPVVTVPQVTHSESSESFSNEVIGIFLSPETEAEYIASRIDATNHSSVLVVWESEKNATDYGSRFKDTFNEIVPARSDVHNISMDKFLTNAGDRERYIRNSDAIVIASSSGKLLTSLKLIPKERQGSVYVPSRILDFADSNIEPDNAANVTIPWRLASLYRGRQAKTLLGEMLQNRRLSTRDIDSLAAAAVAVAFHLENSSTRPDEIRSKLIDGKIDSSSNLADIYGQFAFVSGKLPHLSSVQLEIAKLGKTKNK